MDSTIRRCVSAWGAARSCALGVVAVTAAMALSGCGGAVRELLTDTKVAYSLSQDTASCQVGEPLTVCPQVKILATRNKDVSPTTRPYWREEKDNQSPAAVITNVTRDLQPNGDVQLTVNFTTRVQPGVYTGTIELSILSFDIFTDWIPNRIRYRVEVGSGGATQLTPLPAVIPGRDAWSGYGGNGARTGYAAVSLDASKFTTRWTTWLSTGTGYVGEGISLQAGRIAVTDTKGDAGGKALSNASMLDLRDGKTLWTTLLPELPTQVIANGERLYWAAKMGRVMVTSANGGAVVGEHNGKGNTYADPGWTFAGSRLLMPVDPEVNYLSAIDVSDLSKAVWTTTLPDRLSNRNYRAWGVTADAAAGVAYVNAGGVYRVIRLSDGAIQAEANVPTREDLVFSQIATNQAPVLADDGVSTILLSHRNMEPSEATPNHLTVVDRMTGTQRWDTTGQFMDHPVTARGVVYAANQLTKAVEARSVADGTLLWSWPMESADRYWQRQMVLTDTHLFVSTDQQTLALDLATKQAVWRVPSGGWIGLTPEGVLVVLTQTAATPGFSMLRTFNLR